MDAGIELIKKWEGLRLNAYLCPAKVPTIGYGCTRLGGKPVKLGMRLKDEEEADKILRFQISMDFLPQLQSIPVWRSLNRDQQGVLLSFAWNLGAGFYGSKGFETITRALDNDLSAVPDALMLYVKGGGKTLQGLVNRRTDEANLWRQSMTNNTMINLTKYPDNVIADKPFTVIGKFNGETDATLSVLADDKFKLPDCKTKDGVIDYQLKLNTEGSRKISFHSQNHSASIKVNVTNVKSPPASNKITLSGSVGSSGKNNKDDVTKVQNKLKELGYNIGTVDGLVGNKTIGAIRLFQSIINGQTKVSGDGRVDVNGKTHQWLNAKNAPKWQAMPPTNKAISYHNRELEETWDKHDYGTSWMADAILWIAKDYHQTYRGKNPNAALFTINDVSLPYGGDTPDHSGHETGLCCDIYLPKIDGGSGGIDYLSKAYDLKASEAILRSINRCPMVNKGQVYFNDPVMVKKGLCKSVRSHHHHYHIGVKVPIIQN